MRAKTYIVPNGGGYTPWHRVADNANPISVGFLVALSGSATGATWTMQYGFSENVNQNTVANLAAGMPALTSDYFQSGSGVTVSRTTTTGTIVFPQDVAIANTTTASGTSLIITGTGTALDNQAPVNPSWEVTAYTSATATGTFTTVSSGTITNNYNASVTIIRWQQDPTLVAQTAGATGNIAFPCNYMRMYVSTLTAGSMSLTVNQSESR